MRNSENIYGGECGSSLDFARIPCKSDSYKNWKEMNLGRQPDFVSSLGRLLQDKTSEVGSIGSFCMNDDNPPISVDHPIFQENLPGSSCYTGAAVPKKCCENCKSPPQPQRDPAIADLYRILWLQNEQLSLLHKQVADLVSLKENNNVKPTKADISTSTDDVLPNKSRRTADASVNTLPLSCPNCMSSAQKSIKIVKQNKKPPEDPLLSLKDIDLPRIEYSSSNPSVHIDVNDYDITSSSATDESDTSSTEESPNTDVGWTFYNNVIGQVNNLLDIAKQPISYSSGQEVNESYQLPHSYLSRRVKFGGSSRKMPERTVRNESDVSMKINSLASKYIHCGLNGQVKDISMCNVVSGNTNMSMATIRYMEKHHLIQSPDRQADSHRRKTKTPSKRSSNPMSNKILDITAIRQQPKLLPKFD